MNHVKTTMELSEMGDMIQAFMDLEWTLESESYPAEGDWIQIEDSNQMMIEVVGDYPYFYQSLEK